MSYADSRADSPKATAIGDLAAVNLETVLSPLLGKESSTGTVFSVSKI